MGGTNSELVVASVALVVSVIALLATFMQVLQQYFASASGYSRCNEEVMGGWAKSKSRSFSWDEMRFVVQFDTPIIFVSPPTNDKGPISGEDIHFLDGTPESRSLTNTAEEQGDAEAKPRREHAGLVAGMGTGKYAKERVQTGNHERASWLVLLIAIQRMEEESRQWQQSQYSHHGPPSRHSDKCDLPLVPPTLRGGHTLTVAIQRKRKSWDTMPSSISRPYATTTMCHLIEIMATMGIYWKEFDRSRDQYRAEGNGFMVLGERLSNLGLIFSFQRYGKCRFGRKRVIPVDEVKELCFGYIPTIYREVLDPRRLSSPSELRDLGTLQMATKAEIAETLIVIGCNKNAVQYFLDGNSRTAHLFPVSFEILGMLARTLHIDESYFTYLPNPTSDQWEQRSLFLFKALDSYRVFLDSSKSPLIRRRLLCHLQRILDFQDADAVSRLLLLRSLHTALDDADEVLTAKKGRRWQRVTETSEEGKMSDVDESAPDVRGRRREIVRDVLRAHIQEVLRLLNERDERISEAQAMLASSVQTASPTSRRPGSGSFNESPRFEELDEASPEERQHKFMQVYFEVVRLNVVPVAQDLTRRREDMAAMTHALPQGGAPGTDANPTGPRKRTIGKTRASKTGQTQSGAPVQVGSFGSHVQSRPHCDAVISAGDEEAELKSVVETPTDHDDAQDENDVSLADQPASHDDIWCVLVFRMICWLMLHDFDRQDIQVSKGELLGSRMPVYIA
ncbi:hypothetical protein HIM_06811 [Hirsutella minnesotensis 3608]|uniref:Modin n=1 Tax=Hirsutella minnesotensis 3608 TaxID=1043627 RepID=A0A0F7ZTT9_9HYPO|nr:hypothetical protein HIM_06811 [Hirsutella minnesotensis 3608]